MAVLTSTQINDLMLDRAQANVTTDAPISSTEALRFINDAFADVYEVSGGRIKSVQSSTAWTTAQSATGIVAGILTDIADVQALFWKSSDAVAVATDVVMRRVELERILWLRGAQGHGTYNDKPKLYALSPMATDTAADVNKLQLDYFPAVTGFYFPIRYVRQFNPLSAIDTSVPDVNDLESRDIALLAAARIAPLIGRAELVPSILADVSARTAAALERKMMALQSGRQDA